MKKLTATSTCICGEQINFAIKKATRMTPSITRVKCAGCKSHFMVCAYVDKDKLGREYKFDIEEIEITDKAKFIAKTWLVEKREPPPAA